MSMASLRFMLDVGPIDREWLSTVPKELAARLQ